MKVSIVVCTRDRYALLASCLQSVISSEQSHRYDELIVVDTSCDPLLRRRIEEDCRRIGAKYCYESRRGLSFARNTGIQKSSGEVVVFLDDDFIVERDCIGTLVRNYNDPGVACCNGRMLSYRHDDVSVLFEKYMSYDRGDNRIEATARDMKFVDLLGAALFKLDENRFPRRHLPPYSVGFGFCSFRRAIFDVVGLFDTSLGRGTPRMGSDDVDMYYRILRKGYRIVYEPRALIWHNHRTTMKALVEYAYSSGVSVAAFTEKHSANDPYVFALFVGNALLTLFWSVKALWRSDGTLWELSLAELRGLLRGVVGWSSQSRLCVEDAATSSPSFRGSQIV